jgi:hypothetical protein
MFSISLGMYHTCAQGPQGVKCWGGNEYGQVGDGTTVNRLSPVDVPQFDADQDGTLDADDSCVDWPNPDQALPTWAVTGNDSDCDGQDAEKEAYLGTDAMQQCPDTSTPNDEPIDAWPSDFNDNRVTNLADIVLMGPAFNLPTGADPSLKRFDLNASGSVSLGDVVALGLFFNKTCS